MIQMIEQYLFNRPLGKEYKWDSFYDITKDDIDDYLIWEDLVEKLYVNFYSYFNKFNSLDYTFCIEKYGLFNREKLNNLKTLGKDIIDEIVNISNILAKNDVENYKVLDIEKVKLFSRAMSKELCYFCLVDMTSNARLIPLWDEPFSYQIFLDTDLVRIESIFSQDTLLFIEKAVYLTDSPEYRRLSDDIFYKKFED